MLLQPAAPLEVQRRQLPSWSAVGRALLWVARGRWRQSRLRSPCRNGAERESAHSRAWPPAGCSVLCVPPRLCSMNVVRSCNVALVVSFELLYIRTLISVI